MSTPLTFTSDPQPTWDVARLFPNVGAWTVDEYLDLTDSTNQLVEFTDGCVEFLEMPTTRHQLVLIFLFDALRKFVSDRNLGIVLIAALRLQVGKARFREPDILFASKKNQHFVQDRYWLGADLVLEIVSEGSGSRERDLVLKRADYAAAGIAEYWIVDPRERRITVLALEGGSYVTHGEFTPSQQAASRLLEDFTVDVTAVFQAAEGMAR